MSDELLIFLNQLVEQGRVRVGSNRQELFDTSSIDDRLLTWDRELRLDLPGVPPPLFLPAARWGLRLFYDGCRFLVHRDISAEEIKRVLTEPCPEPDSPLSHYSVDLAFRFLPELYRFARAASKDDPLSFELGHIAAAWPLSSVGVKGIEIEAHRVEVILKHPALRAIYVDRIISLQDKSRLTHPQVQRSVKGAWGLFPQLAPKLADALNESTQLEAETEEVST